MSTPPTVENDAGCVECGKPVDRVLPNPIPEGYECMWSEAMTGRALYCLACYGVIPPGKLDTCICDPAGPCLGAEYDTGSTIECKACLVLDPELPCLNEPEAVGGPYD